MNNYPTLTGARVRLRPMEYADAGLLVNAASDGELWKLPFTLIPSADTVDDYIRIALTGREQGTMLPFIIEDIASAAAIGTTRLWKIDRNNRKLEIGGSWLSASWQRTWVNSEAKFLLLQYAFETLNCVRVQFTTDVTNEKSRNAILRLGAKLEGIVRNERIMADGRKRDSIRFSVIDDEWSRVKQDLLLRLKAQGAGSDAQAAANSSFTSRMGVTGAP
ncbi:GNAT family N-acetyltransferase [Izhakiella australiensis]|uniref:GNAT family N-acetyltransferase n=1 Tax=Izhakiella australiensis TaxID=1926881 RepID=UPI00098F9098|nr:GNAT family protein [Izhakiella australiensis]